LMADRFVNGFDVLAGRPEAADPGGGTYQHFTSLLLDVPLLVWRALLDAELFHAATAEQCFADLELAATDPGDLPFLYEKYVTIPAPNRVHAAASELVTGVVALPAIDGDHVLVPTNLDAPVERRPTQPLGTLQWYGSMTLREGVANAAAPGVGERASAPFVTFERSDASSSAAGAHVVAVASCEGEAVLLAAWIDVFRDELAAVAGVDIVSRSWLASDIAPVGTFVNGELRTVTVDCPNWILVVASVRRDHCAITAMTESLAAEAGVAVAWVEIDLGEGNVSAVEGFPQRSLAAQTPGRSARAARGEGVVHLGGLYRRDLTERLLPDGAADA